MNAYKTYVTLDDSKQVTLAALPFQPGQRLEIIVLVEGNANKEIGERVNRLFDRTQAIPGIAEITEEEILAEIEAYRRGK